MIRSDSAAWGTSPTNTQKYKRNYIEFRYRKPQKFERKYVMGRSRQATISPLRATVTGAFRETQQQQTSGKRRLRKLSLQMIKIYSKYIVNSNLNKLINYTFLITGLNLTKIGLKIKKNLMQMKVGGA